MSDMGKSDQSGAVGVIIVIFLLVLMLFASLGFGFWALNGRQYYKNQAAQIVVAAQAKTKVQTQADDAQIFAEQAKQPLRIYTGPQSYGSISVSFPKTWSGYVDDSSQGQAVVDGYFQPGTIPSIVGSVQNTFALRVQLLAQSYDQILQPYTTNTASKLTETPYSLPKEPGVVGTRLSGQIADKKVGDMIIIPIRDKTLKVWTESTQYESDFNTYILPNLNFSP
jgi:hypothetical protein